MEEKKCLYCQEPLSGRGRRDRKFCDDDCRAMYHYKINRSLRQKKQGVLKRLDDNYDILSNLVDSGVRSIGLHEIQRKGYSIENVTAYRNVSGHDEYRCFDIRYYVTSGKMIMLEKIKL